MLPVTAALAAGILLASWRMPSVWLAATGVVVCVAAAAAVLRTNRMAASAATILAACFLGATLTALQLRTDSLTDDYAVCTIAVDSDPHHRAGAKTQQAEARLESVRDDSGRWLRRRGRLMLYADTTLQLAVGERIVCRGRIRPFGSPSGSEYDGYNAMMRRKGFVGTLYLGDGNILQITDNHSTAMFHSLHRRAVAKIARLPLRPDNMSVAQAVGTGDSSMLSRRLRSDYSRAGTAHLLALSGLHVGIVFVLINLLLRWLPLVTFGHIIRSCVAVVLLWLYVLSTGMPPSAIRAALMFSLLQFARAASADYSALNALSAAAFIALCFDTGVLFDAGFRLSYIAVVAIIFGALPLIRRTRIVCDRHRAAVVKWCISATNFVTATIITGLVATVATAPLVSHMFGIIPLAGILAGPAAIAAAAATVLLTALWIALPLGFAATTFGRAVDFTAGTMNAISEWLASHGRAAIDIRLNATETLLCYVVVTAAVCALASIRNNNPTDKFPIQ